MRRIAYLNGRTYRGAPIARDQVPPLEVDDRVLIFDAGAESGLTFETVYWDEPDLAQRFDAAIIRTCLDYHRHMPRFVETLEAHERAGLRVSIHRRWCAGTPTRLISTNSATPPFPRCGSSVSTRMRWRRRSIISTPLKSC